MTLKDIAKLYNIGRSTLDRYLQAHRASIDAVATRITLHNKTIKRHHLNKKQIKLIVEIMQDPPEGYKLVRGQLIKLNEND